MQKKAEEFLLDTQLGEKKYTVQPLSETGDEISLNIENNSIPVAALELQIRKKVGGRSWFAELDSRFQSMFGINAKELAVFFRLMAVLINAGVPLLKSLEIVSRQTRNMVLKRVIVAVADAIEKGGTLSDSMAMHPRIFEEAHVGMIRSGEASGNLNMVLNDLAEEVEKSASIKRKLRGAMMYPVFIIFVLIGVIVSMMLFVVPKIAEAFAGSGQNLPALTQGLIDVSAWMTQHVVLMFATGFALVLGIVFGKRTYSGKHIWDSLILTLPVFGQIIKKTILARFARTIANLLRSGIPIISALHIVAGSLGNSVYKQRIDLAAEDLSRGISLADGLIDSPLFPDMMVQMIAVGEQTAQLDGIADKIAAYYEEEVDVAISSMTKVLEPFIIVTVGIVVGGLVGAIMLPLIKFSEVAGQL